ncbi:GntR family transcriptional regulator [Poseidonocella sp. HB161398]|uniref:GntR family transcriptional regulator n=1 Tax=Poseidonocella sp. HB161398 TaxID=2320855 RepID=UPI0011088B30|nr:GntR family transcriptional regulator [Poseidonocella sp. HB161398]
MQRTDPAAPAGEEGGKAVPRPDWAEIASLLRDGIRDHRLVPGQRLVETELAARLGASRSAVRAALMALSVEGIVERVPNRGARVRVLGLAEALQIAEIRLAVETACARSAALRATEDELRELGGLAARLAELCDGSGTEEFIRVVRIIRERIVEISGQEVAAELLKQLRHRMIGQPWLLTRRPGRCRATLGFWQDLVAALAAHDPEAAAHALELHAAGVMHAMRLLCDSGQPLLARSPVSGPCARGW